MRWPPPPAGSPSSKRTPAPPRDWSPRSARIQVRPAPTTSCPAKSAPASTSATPTTPSVAPYRSPALRRGARHRRTPRTSPSTGGSTPINPLPPAIPCLIDSLSRAVAAAGFPVHRMPSGAGHDAMILAAQRPRRDAIPPLARRHQPSSRRIRARADVDAALAAGGALSRRNWSALMPELVIRGGYGRHRQLRRATSISR